MLSVEGFDDSAPLPAAARHFGTATYQARTRPHADQHGVTCLAAHEFLLVAALVVKAPEHQAMDSVNTVEAAMAVTAFWIIWSVRSAWAADTPGARNTAISNNVFMNALTMPGV